MGEVIGKVQAQLKRTSGDLILFLLKLFSGAVLGLTFALIVQEVLGKPEGENLLAFFFVIFVTTGVFFRVARSWGFMSVLVFDLIAVLMGLVLRLYIMIAPGS